MDDNKKEKMKNWLETGNRETDKERLIREKQSVENLERQENLIKLGKNMTDMEIVQEASLKKIVGTTLTTEQIQELQKLFKDPDKSDVELDQEVNDTFFEEDPYI